MTIAHGMFVHGSSVIVECPPQQEWDEPDPLVVTRKGFCATCQTAKKMERWFHFAIPTPVIVDDRRLKVGKVWVRYLTNSTPTKSTSTTVQAIHVYDGETKIAGRDDLKLSPTEWHSSAVDVPGEPEVYWGVCISVLVEFDHEYRLHPSSRIPTIEFSAAGCDFR